MKEKIRQLARENFEYELPNILLSEENLEFTVEAGSVFMGSFLISNDMQKDMKGIVYTPCSNLKITNPMFIGKKNEIQFVYDAKKEPFEQKLCDKIHIISNCGETSLSIKVFIVEPYKTTSLGSIKDLFHFANLAHSDWEEALKLFVSSDFERVFLKEEELKSRYQSLMKATNRDISMEEFLISIQKKSRINIHSNRTTCEYKNCFTNFMDKIILEKDNWGYESFQVSTDCDFLLIDKMNFTTKDFCGNRYDLEYLIERDKLYEGINFGKIKIETKTDTKEILVKVSVNHESNLYENHKKREEVILSVTQNYLNLRTHQISQDNYIAELEEIIKKSKVCFSYWEQKLLELHTCIINYQAYAEVILKEMEEKVEKIKEESLLCYTTYLYLRALYTKKKETIKEAESFIRAYYENGFDSWQLLWFLFYLGDTYEKNPEKKWEEIARCIDNGTNSPIIYYEACACLEGNLKARTYFQKSLHKILAFGVKMNCLSDELTDLFCFLSEQEQKASPWIMSRLYFTYETSQSKEVLFTICKLLILNKKKEKKYFKWYAKGVKDELKLENLYEYYIETMEENFSVKIPSKLFLFFQYDNQLSFEKKAFFYAYIVKNKHRDMANYVAYEKIMRKFSLEALKQEKIDRNLGILYEEFFTLEDVNERLSIAFSNVMFRYELTCEDKKMVGVYVSHKELSKEVYTPIENGCCNIDIFTENPSIVFVNARGNRFTDSVHHKITRLFHIHGLSLKCYEYCKSNSMLLMNLFEKIYKYQKQNENSILIQRRCVLLPLFKSCYKGLCFETLIQYYFDCMDTEALKEMLLLADFDWLSDEFRQKAICYCMIYDLRDKAYFLLQEYGFYNIPIHRIIHFCTEEIKRNGMDNKNKFLLQMAFYCFNNEKYNESILQYLMFYYEGNTEMILKLWKSCVNFGLDAYVLEERILSQVLFTEVMVTKALEVFKSYYKKDGDETIIRAYLAYTSYTYFINERLACEELFPIMKNEVFYKESTVGALALLLFYSKQETFSKEELAFCETYLTKLTKVGLIFPFYKEFAGKIKLPQQIGPYLFVTYTCNPKNKVKIHYIIENQTSQEEYITKCMDNVYFGIHVIPFLLFENETLKYYITEENGKQEIITESVRMDRKNAFDSEEDSTFKILNGILTSREKKDDKTMITQMEKFITYNYTVEKLLKIL